MGTPATSVLPAYIFILHFEPRLMSVLYGIPTIRPLEFQMGKPLRRLEEAIPNRHARRRIEKSASRELPAINEGSFVVDPAACHPRKFPRFWCRPVERTRLTQARHFAADRHASRSIELAA